MSDNRLNNVIDVRLGDGLSVLRQNESIQNITICGMGGPLIARILNEGRIHLANGPRLILQSNIQTEVLRYTLMTLNYQIIEEVILEEKGHIYEIVVAAHMGHQDHLDKRIKIWTEIITK